MIIGATVAAGAFAAAAHATAPTVDRGGVQANAPAVRLSMPTRHEPRIIGYFPSWGIYEREYEVADVPAELVTHVNYAFANIADGRCALGDPWADIERPLPTDDRTLPYRGNFNQLAVLKSAHPHLKTVISVGGSTWSSGFSAAAATPNARRTFASSCVTFMEKYGFDGLSIDWEYPVSGGAAPGVAADTANFTELLVELRTQIDALNRRTKSDHVLTIAGPAGAPNMANIDIAALPRLVDWVNVMTYDFAGPWSPKTGHNSPLYEYPGIEDRTFTVDSAMRRWVQAGMPAQQLNTGLAFYGRVFGGVTGASPARPFTSIPMGTTESGQFDYAHLVNGALGRATVSFDAAARVPFAYDATTRTWFSYDNPQSIEEKAAYTRSEGYGGVLVWELSNDASGDPLLRAANRGLGR
jgi:chitinase